MSSHFIVQQIMVAKATMAGTLVMAPKSVTFRQHDHLVSVLFGGLLSHSYKITFLMFLYLVLYTHELLGFHHFRIMESQTVILDDDVESSKSGNVLKLVLHGVRVVLQNTTIVFSDNCCLMVINTVYTSNTHTHTHARTSESMS